MRPAQLHQSRELLVAFALGRIDEAAAQTIALHLETCADCRQVVIDAPPDDFLDRVRAAAAGEWSEDTLSLELATQEEYDVLRELGRGGMGVVYLVRNRRMDRLEALKVMKRSLLERCAALDRFEQEIRSAARLHHPNIVTAYNAPDWDGSLALAMEYVPGEDLHQVVQLRGPLPVAGACLCAFQAALALQHAHEKKMVHRDIKPSNLMLAQEGERTFVKVLDFGLSKATSENEPCQELTADGQLLGSLHFIAPEQASDAANADIRADIYSLGCTLYYLLSGHPPFQAKSGFELLKAHERQSPDPLDAIRPGVPTALAAVVSKMMAKEPAARFQTPGEAAHALEPFFESDQSMADRQTPVQGAPQQSRATRPFAIGLGLVLAVGALLGALKLSLKTPDGVVEIQVNVDQPEVLIDGNRTTVHWENGDKQAEIHLTPGVHEIELKKGKFKAYGKKVVMAEGGREVIVARLIPLSPPGAAKANKMSPFALGVWKVVGDIVQQESKTPAVLLFGSPDFCDVDFSCELWHGTEDTGISVVFRATDLQNYYYFEIGGFRNSLFDLEAVEFGGFRRLGVSRGSAATDRWSRIRVKLRGDSIEGYVDDELLVQGKDDRRLKGYVGLRTWAGPARFRNLKVTDASGKVLWDGLPELGRQMPLVDDEPDRKRP